MIDMHGGVPSLRGPKGSLPIREDDEITLKLAMLYEGQCEGLGPQKSRKEVRLYAPTLSPDTGHLRAPGGRRTEKRQTGSQDKLSQDR